MRFVKASERLPDDTRRPVPPPQVIVRWKYLGEYQRIDLMTPNQLADLVKNNVDPDYYEWLDEDVQDEGWVPVFDGILEFTKTTFPDAGPVEHLKKLVQEAWEASKAPGDITEYADCLLCLFAAAGKAGITHNQLVKAAAHKLEECKGRKWQRLEDGTYQHIPPATT